MRGKWEIERLGFKKVVKCGSGDYAVGGDEEAYAENVWETAGTAAVMKL